MRTREIYLRSHSLYEQGVNETLYKTHVLYFVMQLESNDVRETKRQTHVFHPCFLLTNGKLHKSVVHEKGKCTKNCFMY